MSSTASLVTTNREHLTVCYCMIFLLFMRSYPCIVALLLEIKLLLLWEGPVVFCTRQEKRMRHNPKWRARAWTKIQVNYAGILFTSTSASPVIFFKLCTDICKICKIEPDVDLQNMCFVIHGWSQWYACQCRIVKNTARHIHRCAHKTVTLFCPLIGVSNIGYSELSLYHSHDLQWVAFLWFVNFLWWVAL